MCGRGLLDYFDGAVAAIGQLDLGGVAEYGVRRTGTRDFENSEYAHSSCRYAR